MTCTFETRLVMRNGDRSAHNPDHHRFESCPRYKSKRPSDALSVSRSIALPPQAEPARPAATRTSDQAAPRSTVS
jgi:hypothetical protein